jgi:Fe(3+) dicitrate transport protein
MWISRGTRGKSAPAPPRPVAPYLAWIWIGLLVSSHSMAEPYAAPATEAAEDGAGEPAPPVEDDAMLSEVTVTGTRIAETAGAAHVVDEKKLERQEHDDPHAVLLSVPGVQVRGEDGVGLRPNIGIRGVNPDRSKKITLLEDRVLIAPAPYSAPAAYYFPLITRMVDVRVIKGPATIAFGPQTVSGAIDLVTRRVPRKPSGAIDLAGGEYGYAKAHAYFGSGTDQSAFLVEGVHLRSDGFKELPSGADTGFYRNEWMLKASHLLDPDAEESHELELKLTYSDEVSNETYLGLTDADFAANPRRRYAASQLDRMQNHRTAIAATHIYEPTPELSVTTTVYRNDFSRVWRKVNGFRGASLFDVLRNPNEPRNAVYVALLNATADSATPDDTLLVGPNDRQFAAHGIQTRVSWETTTGAFSHRIEYGLRLHYDRVERRHSEDGFLLVGGELVPEGTPTVVTAYNEAHTDALALHAADAIGWRDLTLTPGIRVEVMRSRFIDRITGTETGRLAQVVLPGIGAYYGLTDTLGIFGGAYRGFSPPAPGSEEHVDPELSVNYEAGARFSPGKSRAEAIGFYNNYSNLTDVCTLSSGCLDADLDRQFDAGEARIYGVELYAQHDFDAGPVTIPVSGAYTWTRAEFLSSFASEDPIFGDVEEGDFLPYVPRHQTNVSLGVERDATGANVAVTYISRMREEAGQEPLDEALTTDEQFLVDVGARVGLLEPFVLYANIKNLLDNEFVVSHRPFGARPNAPRWVQVGVKAAF